MRLPPSQRLPLAVRRALVGRVASDWRGGDPGFTLMGTLLGLAISAVVAAVAITFYESARSRQQAYSEQNNLQHLITQIGRGYGAAGSFAGISPSAAIAAHLVPPSMISGTSILNAWGGVVGLSSVTVNGVPNSGLQVTDPGVPQDACVGLIENISASQWSVTVNGQGVPLTHGAPAVDSGVSPALALQACNQDLNTLVLVHTVGALGGVMAVAPGPAPARSQTIYPTFTPPVLTAGGPVSSAPDTVGGGGTPPPFAPGAGAPGTQYAFPGPNNPAPCTLPTPSVETQNLACPTGENGLTTQQRFASCPSPTGGYTWSPWTTTYQSCAPACVAPPARSSTRTATCPSGSATSSGSSTFTQYETTSYLCHSPSGPLIPDTSPWSPAASSVCITSCVAPASKTVTRSYSCPSGQVTSTGATSFTQSTTKSYSCPSPTGTPTASYGTWTPSAATACAPACVAPASKTVYRSYNCPSGEVTPSGFGSFTQSTTKSYSCPSPTGTPTASYGTWTPSAASVCAPAGACSNTSMAGKLYLRTGRGATMASAAVSGTYGSVTGKLGPYPVSYSAAGNLTASNNGASAAVTVGCATNSTCTYNKTVGGKTLHFVLTETLVNSAGKYFNKATLSLSCY